MSHGTEDLIPDRRCQTTRSVLEVTSEVEDVLCQPGGLDRKVKRLEAVCDSRSLLTVEVEVIDRPSEDKNLLQSTDVNNDLFYLVPKMSAFSLSLKDNSIVTGVVHIPSNRILGALSRRKPLLIAVPGGSFTSDYFDADDNHSLRAVCESIGIPAIALNRPGYDATPPPTGLDKSANSFIQKSGRWLHELSLPAIWDSYADVLEVSSIVLYGHSIGAAVCVVAAAEYEKEAGVYKLSGLALGGIGCQPVVNDFNVMFEEERNSESVGPLRRLKFPTDAMENFMLGNDSSTYDTSIVSQLGRIQHDIYLQELYDIEFLWPGYWTSYARSIKIPVLYNAGELDLLWHINEVTVRKFGEAFEQSTSVSLVLSRKTAHTIELSHQAHGYYVRLMGFAIECAAQSEIQVQR